MIQVLGVIVFVMGFYIRYRLKRKKYYRRLNPVQRVSYERKVLSNAGEEFLHFLYYLLIVAGVFIFSFGWFVNKEAKTHHPVKQSQSVK